MPNPVMHFEIMAKGYRKRTQEFYTQLFGWHVDDDNPMNYGMVDTHSDGAGIGGASQETAITPTSPSTWAWMTFRRRWTRRKAWVARPWRLPLCKSQGGPWRRLASVLLRPRRQRHRSDTQHVVIVGVDRALRIIKFQKHLTRQRSATIVNRLVNYSNREDLGMKRLILGILALAIMVGAALARILRLT